MSRYVCVLSVGLSAWGFQSLKLANATSINQLKLLQLHCSAAFAAFEVAGWTNEWKVFIYHLLLSQWQTFSTRTWRYVSLRYIWANLTRHAYTYILIDIVAVSRHTGSWSWTDIERVQQLNLIWFSKIFLLLAKVRKHIVSTRHENDSFMKRASEQIQNEL